MQIKVTIKRAGPSFPQIAKQERYALSLAINRSLEEAQAAQRQSMASNFIDRRRGFLNRMVKIGPGDRATRERLVGRIRIIGPEGREEASEILARHEGGGQRTTGGGYSIDPAVRIRGFFYIPTQAIRPQFSATVSRKLYPKALHLQPSRYEGTTRSGKSAGYYGRHRTSGGKEQIKGSDRTFVMFGANGGEPIGIFQRKGASKYGGRGRSAGRRTVFRQGGNVTRDDIRLIWSFRRTVTLKPRLHFYQVVPSTINQRLLINYSGFLPMALRTAK